VDPVDPVGPADQEDREDREDPEDFLGRVVPEGRQEVRLEDHREGLEDPVDRPEAGPDVRRCRRFLPRSTPTVTGKLTQRRSPRRRPVC